MSYWTSFYTVEWKNYSELQIKKAGKERGSTLFYVTVPKLF